MMVVLGRFWIGLRVGRSEGGAWCLFGGRNQCLKKNTRP